MCLSGQEEGGATSTHPASTTRRAPPRRPLDLSGVPIEAARSSTSSAAGQAQVASRWGDYKHTQFPRKPTTAGTAPLVPAAALNCEGPSHTVSFTRRGCICARKQSASSIRVVNDKDGRTFCLLCVCVCAVCAGPSQWRAYPFPHGIGAIGAIHR